MKVRGEFVATLSYINGTPDRMVHLTWIPKNVDIGVGRVICKPKAEEISAWEEAIEQWNCNRVPTSFSQGKYDILLEEAASLFVNAAKNEIGRRLRE